MPVWGGQLRPPPLTSALGRHLSVTQTDYTTHNHFPEAIGATTYTYSSIPPRSRHNVTNTGSEMLEYVYVVAPIASGK